VGTQTQTYRPTHTHTHTHTHTQTHISLKQINNEKYIIVFFKLNLLVITNIRNCIVFLFCVNLITMFYTIFYYAVFCNVASFYAASYYTVSCPTVSCQTVFGLYFVSQIDEHDPQNFAIRVIYNVGFGTSVVALSVALFLFIFFRYHIKTRVVFI